MKKYFFVFLLGLFIVSGSVAFAEDTKATIGLRGWVNSWEITDSVGDSIKSDDSVLMIGPYVNVRFDNNWFLGGSLLTTMSDYEFSYADCVGCGGIPGMETLSRTDIDLMAGYMFTPRFGAFFGYKSISGDYKDEWPLGSTWATGSFDITGPGIGILGNIPLSDSVALYGSLSYMWLDFELTIEGYSASEDMTGSSFEIGLAFVLDPQWSANVGIKSQVLTGEDTDLEHSFAGLTAGINYTF